MAPFREQIEQHPIMVVLTSLVVGFVSGVAVYNGILRIAKLEVVQEGAYIKKSDVVGNLLRKEAVREIEHLLEIGEKLNESQIAEAEEYMLRVHTFVYYLGLPYDVEKVDYKSSHAAQRIDEIIRNALLVWGRKNLEVPLDQKVSRIMGVLKGLKASLSARQE